MGRTFGAAHLRAAIEGHSQDAGDGGFADAAMAREDVAVGYPVLSKSIEQCARDVILAGDVGKALRTVFACQNLITHAIDDSQVRV